MSLQGFCAAVPEPHLKLLNKNTTDIDYIGVCCCLWYQRDVPHRKHSRAGRSSQEGPPVIDITRGCRGKPKALWGSWVSVSSLYVDHVCSTTFAHQVLKLAYCTSQSHITCATLILNLENRRCSAGTCSAVMRGPHSVTRAVLALSALSRGTA
jgi:hypothetical protein